MGLIIESGIPIPSGGGKTGFAGALKQMEVGQSVLVQRRSSASIAWIQKKLHGRLFTTRKIEGGFRVWRVQ